MRARYWLWIIPTALILIPLIACGDSQSDRDSAIVQALPSPTPSPDIRATVVAEITATAVAQPTATFTPEPTATFTSVPTPTFTPEPTATDTPVPTPTFTPVPTATDTPVPTPTFTPVPTATDTPVPTPTFTPLPTATPTLADLVKRLEPSLVQIITSFGTGSGFIIDADGLVVTNAHVVGRENTVDVRLADGQSFQGEVLGIDEGADVALLDMRAFRKFQPATLRETGIIDVGDDVIAIGFPLGDMLQGSPTITRGIVSAKRVSASGVQLLQTDAAINPGSSGGPLFDRSGKVVGVNTVKLFEATDGRHVEGIGLAVSINEVKGRLDSLARGENVLLTAPTEEPISTPEAHSSANVFWLDSTELPHDDDEFIETISTLQNVRNFWIHSEFGVPYATDVGDWTVGFLFRDSGGAELSYIVMTGDGQYSHRLRRGGEETILEDGVVQDWDQNVDAMNSISLIVIEDRGWLFANSEYISDLDVSGANHEGELHVATGLLVDTEVPGHSTRVSSVGAQTIEHLHGPQAGTLNVTDQAELIDTWSADVDLSSGFARGEVQVPDDVRVWSAGILFRDAGDADFLVFGIKSSGRWGVYQATESGDGWRTLEEGYSPDVDVTNPILNHLEVLFIGDIAVLYSNGQSLGTADISSVSMSGDIQIAYGLYADDDPGTVRFEGFTVWGLID